VTDDSGWRSLIRSISSVVMVKRIAEVNVRIVPNAAEVLAELQGIRGQISPEMVVEEARDPASPLHDYFTWDDEEAAAAEANGEVHGASD
jgi:hypothetical protein